MASQGPRRRLRSPQDSDRGRKLKQFLQACDEALLKAGRLLLEPGPINTFQGWQALGRNVKRGQRALILCMLILVADEAVKAEATELEITPDMRPTQVVDLTSGLSRYPNHTQATGMRRLKNLRPQSRTHSLLSHRDSCALLPRPAYRVSKIMRA